MDMDEKVCVVTGANTGIGLETARELARRGAHVVMTARNMEKGEAALADVKSTTGSDRVQLVQLDLASLASVRKAAETILTWHEDLHVLVNNAGLILSERETTEDGFEATIGINHLGHFLLTRLLLDALLRSAPCRVVNLSSEGHRMARKGLDFDDLMVERRPYGGMNVYCESKLANILFTKELARRYGDQGLVSHAVHPGVVASGFAADGDTAGWFNWMTTLIRPFMITPAKGAATTLHVATSDEAGASNGLYWKRSKVSKPTAQARDEQAAKRLWEISEELLGLA